MRKVISLVFLVLLPFISRAQQADSTVAPTLLTLEDALRIALSENASVKVADQEIERTGYARKGSYSALFPQINGSASYQRTIKKQVMYMDGGGFDMTAMIGDALSNYLLPLYAAHPEIPFPTPAAPEPEEGASSNEGFSVGRWNTWSAGINASMPLVNAQLWQSLRISDQDVELAVEKARSSRLETVGQVKQAFFACLLAREAFKVYKSAYENALIQLFQDGRVCGPLVTVGLLVDEAVFFLGGGRKGQADGQGEEGYSFDHSRVLFVYKYRFFILQLRKMFIHL